ncbi:hypothetical protein GCM10017083_04900 [Thalassobaculum fulvum]|uniref:Site-specific recombinase XerD n=1 Tax=Thalassobaculum fulvum TaxID=1633335 RepID=A0A918XN47_9PROT|nr:site-specific integrase [Thalassobaculum fulvum]GHD41033.1 hypothetical protein GCM10017083_04900 [Thalassobaculum fulvum]
MAKHPGLHLKGLTWFLHRRWPGDVAHHYDTTFVSESLRTRDFDEAVRRYHRRMAELEQEWVDLRSWTPQKLANAREIIRAGKLWGWGQAITLQAEHQDRKVPACEIDAMPVWLIKLVAERDTFLPDSPATGTKLKSEYPDWEQREHCRLALRNLVRNDGTEYVEWLQRRSAELEADGVSATPLPMQSDRFDALVKGNTKRVSATTGQRTLSTVLDDWRQARQPTDKTYDLYKAKVRRFTEVHGEIPLEQVTRAAVSAFTDVLKQMPLHMSNKERTKPLPEIVEATRDAPGPRVSASAIRQHVECIRMLVNYAIDQGWLESDPLAGLKMKGQPKKSDRLPFDQDHLQRIVAHISKFDDHRFWLPILAAYTGARLNELGQLLVSDVRQTGDVRYISINVHDGKRTKNAGSIRDVPLHRDVLGAGFIEYVETVKDGPLFPGLQPDKHGTVTGNYTKQFGRMLRSEIGITDKRLVFHSFRHRFKDACLEAEIPEGAIQKMMGHHDRSTSGLYGAGYGIASLHSYIERIDMSLQLERRAYR